MEKRKATGYNDCYNQPIHEGDIIHDLHYVGREKRKHYYEVVIKEGKVGMENVTNRNNFIDFQSFTFTSEVIIGNKFDNPELLR